MSRANETVSKVFYKGSTDDFIVLVDDVQILDKWRNDSTIPLVDVVNGFDIFATNNHGTQGILERVANSSLENEFGTSNKDKCIVEILKKGDYQSSLARENNGNTNVANGPTFQAR
ncbi:hypothetical protein FE257_010983 [Aspergillus nanangensis]|uniref:Ribosome maturation protein SDO1/SBDS N-terminal domain-containing protein n=1 Tax=Aspergillus nanangensis TaxID=2582783 RepID=A0AAD4CI12_ASPNN|nr:hypothetical protein FE257_010983 [Aspergillus nanangensis]